MSGIGLGGAGEDRLADGGEAVALEAAAGFVGEGGFDETLLNSGI